MKFVSATAVAVVLCVGCSSQMQRSAPLSPDYLLYDNPLLKRGLTGIPYFLPDTVLPLTVSGEFVLLPERKKNDPPTDADFEYALTVSIGTPKQVADPNATLLLEYQPEAGASDTFKLAVGGNGLLSTISSTSKDETGAIIIKLAELAKEGFRAATAVGKRSAALVEAPPNGNKEDLRRQNCAKVLRKMSVSTEINLSDSLVAAGSNTKADLPKEAFNGKIVRAMRALPDPTMPEVVQTLALGGKRSNPLPGTESPAQQYIYPNAKAYSGIVFRLMVPRTFTVDLSTTGADFGNGCMLSSEAASMGDLTFMVADPRKTFVVDVSRTAFVSKKVNLTVSDGVLLGIEVDKPSELLAAITIPVEVLKIIASIPAELLSIKIKQVSDQNNLSAAQIEMLKLQVDMIRQRQALIDAQNNTPGSQ